MKEFLKTVAEHYRKEICNADGMVDSFGLSDYLFVFPNRRSSLFFSMYLIDKSPKPLFAPEMTTISDLFMRLDSDHPHNVPDRIELLFRLYGIYKRLSNSNESFDSFLFWGEMLLGDFNDADKYMVDTKLLFNNVTELKEIEETFGGLEPEQIEIIRSFWKNFDPEKPGASKAVFKATWKIMYELYSAFGKELKEENEAYDGMLQRAIIEELRHNNLVYTVEEERERLQRLLGKKVVFVGLTALSKTELELMEHLKKHGIAEFCWDYASAHLNDKSSHASYFKASTIDTFPNVIDDEELKAGLVADSEKKIRVIEVPSGVGQAVQASRILQEWKGKEAKDAMRTAVVLPDEKMLLPMLYSIPKEYEPCNVTMGYSLKSTTIATFIDNIAHLQQNVQLDKEHKPTFFHKNVLPLLATSYLQKLTDGKAVEVSREIIKKSRYRVSIDSLKGNMLMEAVFKVCSNGRECISYLENILSILAKQAEKELEEQTAAEEQDKDDLFGEVNEEERVQGVFSDIEREFLFTYIKLAKSLKEKLEKFNMEISAATYFTLLHKFSMGETVSFVGEPLDGLQVMGVLETRDVDFDNLIILSMNEGVFPAKPLYNSFVPMNLRHAFGMPTQEHRDAVFAYHFYRMISRATNIVMIYDSRSEGMQGGEPSRYIKQLEYIYNIEPEYYSVQYTIGIEDKHSITIEKDDRIMGRLEECKTGHERKISATALKRYITCPLRFYFEFVEKLRPEDNIEAGIDDKTFGSVVHLAIQKLYDPAKGRLISAQHIEAVYNDKPLIRKAIREAFAEEMNVTDVGGYLSLVEEIIFTYVRDILEHDKHIGEFAYIDSEKSKTYEYEVKDENGNTVFRLNIIAVFDRIDRLKDGTLRIVDYKTGSSKGDKQMTKLGVPEISMIFDPETYCSEEAFQIMLYSVLYEDTKIQPNLYFVRDFHREPKQNTQLLYLPAGKTPISDFDKYKPEFKKAFDKLILDIFDPNKPFVQVDDKKKCEYCSFKDICQRD